MENFLILKKNSIHILWIFSCRTVSKGGCFHKGGIQAENAVHTL